MKKLLPILFSIFLLAGCAFTPKESSAPSNPGETDPGEGGDTPGGDDPVDTKVFPTDEILAFYEDKGVTGVVIPEYKVNSSLILDYSIKEFEYSYFELVIQGDISSLYKQAATKLNYSLYGSDTSVYKDASNKVVFTVAYKSIGNNTVIKYETYDEYAFYMGDIDIEDDGYKYTAVEYTFSVADNMKDYSGQNMDNITVTSDQIKYTFKKESANIGPSVYNKNGWHVRFYANTSLTVSSESITLKRLSFILLSGSNKGTVSADSGSVGYNSDETEYVWTGEAKTVKFIANDQIRFTDIDVKGVKCEKIIPSTDGVSTVAQVYESIQGYSYTPNNVGWYLTDTTVKLQVKAIDCIDSADTTAGYDANARGKVLCADETGAILVSSSTSSNNPVSLYAAAKKYMNSGSCYEVEGKIAFLNDVVEIKVDSYKYNSALEVNVNVDALVEKTISSQSELLADLESTKTNSKGYGTSKIVKMTGLTYFNKYNSAGSYLFLGSDSKIVPVYSLDDNARSNLVKDQVYDIIGFESMYKGRPSLRILKVIENSVDEPTIYDFMNLPTKVENLSSFYQISTHSGESYKKSELTVYEAEVYVSQYALNKYTLSSSYYYDASSKCYTTGSSQVNAANHNALGVFNENLDYKQVFDALLINLCETEEEVKECKFTVYFTLAYLDNVDGKNMWRVNVFEDLVYSTGFYNAKKETITFDTDVATCTREDGVYQQWSQNGITVRNESTSKGTIERDVNYLKLKDKTKFSISYAKPIVGVTFYTASFSGFGYFTSLNYSYYRSFKDYTTLVFSTYETTVIEEEVGVYSTGNTDYIKITSMVVYYQD